MLQALADVGDSERLETGIATRVSLKDWPPLLTRGGIAATTSLQRAREALLHHGPIAMLFDAYQDFWSYAGGIYASSLKQFVGHHVCLVIGYGPNFLIGVNSWGHDWGENGTFKYALTSPATGERLPVIFYIPPAPGTASLPQAVSAVKAEASDSVLWNGSWPVDDSAQAAQSNVSWNHSEALQKHGSEAGTQESCGVQQNNGGEMLVPPQFAVSSCACAERCRNNTACAGWTWSGAVPGAGRNCFLRSTWDPAPLETCAGLCWSAQVPGRGGVVSTLTRGGSWGRAGAGGNQTTIAMESPGFCRWLQTTGCTPDGPRDPSGDRSCDVTLTSADAGFCDCDGNGVRDLEDPAFACASTAKSCAQACRAKVRGTIRTNIHSSQAQPAA